MGANELSTADKKRLNALLRTFQAFAAINPSLPIGLALAYLAAAAEEGRAPFEYEKTTGLTQSTMSRHLLDLTERGSSKERKTREGGLEFLTWRANPVDYRTKQFFLTPRGRAFLRQLLANFERASS